MGRLLPFALVSAGLVSACTSPWGPELGRSERGIVGGEETTEYPAVPYLSLRFSDGTGGGCSGTLVSPRVVLTAAHCVDPDDDPDGSVTLTELEAYFGSTIGGNDPAFIETIAAEDWIHVASWSLAGGDFALVLLEHDARAEPMAYNTAPLTEADLGKPLHLVGWGNSREGAGAGVKRHVYADLTHFENDWLLGYGDADGNTCQGDSGGPSFMTIGGQEVVVGVTSWGERGCLGVSGAGRVAGYAAEIERFIAERDVPRPPQLSILRPAEGATVSASFPVQVDASDDTRIERLELHVDGAKVADIPTQSAPYIVNTPALPDGAATIEVVAADNRGDETRRSVTVTVDASCADCGAGGGLGQVCTSNETCDSQLCGTVNDESLCTSECTPSDDQCPGGFSCLADSPERGYCWPADEGGCRAGGESGLAGLLLALGAVMAARRRRE